jgi:urease accessory protein
MNMQLRIVALLGATLAAGPTLAHSGEELGGLTAGLMHPISGLDHVVALRIAGSWIAAAALMVLALALRPLTGAA